MKKLPSPFMWLLCAFFAVGEIYWLSQCENSRGGGEEAVWKPAHMCEDISYFFSKLRTVHPLLYQRYDSASFVELEKNMKEACATPKTPREFEYILLKAQRFLDGHTGFFVKELYKSIPKERFPAVRFLSDKMLLDKDTLLQIGDVPCSQLSLALDSMVSWEYSVKLRDRKKNDLLNVLLYNKFNMSYPYPCVVTKPRGERVDTLIRDIESTSRFYDYLNRVVSDRHYQRPFDSAYYRSESIAVLYYNTSDFLNNKKGEEAFARFIDVFFEKVERYNIQTLFIDVTQNGGGSDGAHKAIFARLNRKDTRFESHLSGKREGVKAFCKYREKLSGGREWVETMGKPILKDGIVSLTYQQDSQTDQFGGDVFILVGDKTYSAAFDFCAWCKRSKSGILVGEELGQHFPFCGNVVAYTLPHYKISFWIPSTLYWETPALPLKDGYLQPDIPYLLEHPLKLEDFKMIREMGRNRAEKN